MSKLEKVPGSAFTPEALTEEDIPSLLLLETEAFGDDSWSEKSIRAEHEMIPPRFSIIKDGMTIAGYVHVQIGHDSPTDGPETDGIIGSIAVAKSHQGRGLGELLLKHGIQQLTQRGALRVHLRTSTSNEPMQGLANKLGFEEIGRNEGYYQDGTDAIILVKPIDQQ